MLIVGSIDFFQGLIALFDDEYYVVTPAGFLVVDLTGWGWIMLIWGVLLVLAGLGLLTGQSWARWFRIVVVSLNFLVQLGFLGNSAYPLWTLTAQAFNIIILYALVARWEESAAELIPTPPSNRPHDEAVAQGGARRPQPQSVQSSAPGDARAPSEANHRTKPMFLLLASLLFIFLPSPWNLFGGFASLVLGVLEVTYWQRRMRRRRLRRASSISSGQSARCRSGSPLRARSASWVSSGRLVRAPSFPPGSRVRVVAVDGLTLEVEPVDEEAVNGRPPTDEPLQP